MSQYKKKRVIIIEDEQPSIEMLSLLIKKRKELDLAGVVKTGNGALKLLSKEKFDLIFLDINLPQQDGLKVLSKVPQKPFFIVMSAGKESAIESLNMGAVDYLLKPFTPDRFNQAVDRYLQLDSVQRNGSKLDIKNKRLSFFEDKNLVTIFIRDVYYIESNQRFSLIVTEHRIYKSRKKLSAFAGELSGYGFLQLHRQFLVNEEYIVKKIHTGGGNYVVQLSDPDDTKVPLGRSYLKNLSKILGVD